MITHRLSRLKNAVLVLGLALATLSVVQLERARLGVEMRDLDAGTTPATLYQTDESGPVVVIAHGFAGSRQLMEAFSLTLARSGFRVVAFDFQGHGRNPVPMSGDVTAIEGTTARLVDETGRVIDAARAETGYAGPVALLGHSMATDVIVRAADGDPGIGALVAVSMFSEAVTATAPDNLLIITGQWEPYLRTVALDAVRQVYPGADEGQTVRADDLRRRAVVAPFVEHVGVLYSPVSLREAREWIGESLGHSVSDSLAATGPWLSGLMGALVLLVWPLAARLGPRQPVPDPLPLRWFLAILALPAVIAPVLATQVTLDILPVMVADTLALMFLIFGGLQLIGLRLVGLRLGRIHWPALVFLVLWGIGVFGIALDRYGASFLPIPERVAIIAALTLGTVPFMLADAALTGAGQAPFWRRAAARIAVFTALSIAVALDPERLFFIVIIFPVLLLFYVVHGLMGRWIGQHAGPMAAGLGLGLVLAWALGVSFPLFDPGL